MSGRDDAFDDAREAAEDESSDVLALELRAVAGVLASGVAGQMAHPLRQLRETLAAMVESLDRHVSGATGPTPLAWKAVQALRQELAAAYLQSRTVARLAGDLHDSVSHLAGAPAAVDLNKQVEAALNLARHRLTGHTEIFVDLGSVPHVRASEGPLILCMARVMLLCADSASAIDGGAVSVRTRYEPTHEVVVALADNGIGLPKEAAALRGLLARIAERFGGSFEGTSESGIGSAFELRLPAVHQRA